MHRKQIAAVVGIVCVVLAAVTIIVSMVQNSTEKEQADTGADSNSIASYSEDPTIKLLENRISIDGCTDDVRGQIDESIQVFEGNDKALLTALKGDCFFNLGEVESAISSYDDALLLAKDDGVKSDITIKKTRVELSTDAVNDKYLELEEVGEDYYDTDEPLL